MLEPFLRRSQHETFYDARRLPAEGEGKGNGDNQVLEDLRDVFSNSRREKLERKQLKEGGEQLNSSQKKQLAAHLKRVASDKAAGLPIRRFTPDADEEEGRQEDDDEEFFGEPEPEDPSRSKNSRGDLHVSKFEPLKADAGQLFILVGKSERGKTHFLKWLLYHGCTRKWAPFQRGMVFVRTKFNCSYKFHPASRPNVMIFEDFRLDILKKYVENLKKIYKEHGKLEPSFLVFDDLVGVLNNDDPWFVNFIGTYRHYNITIFIAVQYLTGRKSVSPIMREQTTACIMFNSKNHRTVENLFENFGQLFESRKEFQAHFYNMTESMKVGSKHAAMVYFEWEDDYLENYMSWLAPADLPEGKVFVGVMPEEEEAGEEAEAEEPEQPQESLTGEQGQGRAPELPLTDNELLLEEENKRQKENTENEEDLVRLAVANNVPVPRHLGVKGSLTGRWQGRPRSGPYLPNNMGLDDAARQMAIDVDFEERKSVLEQQLKLRNLESMTEKQKENLQLPFRADDPYMQEVELDELRTNKRRKLAEKSVSKSNKKLLKARALLTRLQELQNVGNNPVRTGNEIVRLQTQIREIFA